MIISPKKRATMHSMCVCVCVCVILPLCLTQECTRWLELPGSLQSAMPASLYFIFIVGADEAVRNEDQGVSDSTDLREPTDRHAGKNIRTDTPWWQKGQSLTYESMTKLEIFQPTTPGINFGTSYVSSIRTFKCRGGQRTDIN